MPVLLVMGLIGWFYFWTIAPVAPYRLVTDNGMGYHNLLVKGLLKGQLSLDAPVDPFLRTLADPYDPVQRGDHGLHDASYYRGKYYLYFGLTPTVVLFLPFRILTGYFINEHFAVYLFALMGFAFSVALLWDMAAKQFPRAGLKLKLPAVLALGLATMVPPLLRRPDIWEVSIVCAYAFFMGAIYCVWRALGDGGTKRWLATASLMMGLCIGARPVYLLAAVILCVPLRHAAVQRGREFWRDAAWWKQAFWAFSPILLVGAGLALYNYQRFGNPLEFGQTYQMSGANETKAKHFSLSYVLFNLRVYFLSAAGWSPFFPFVTVITPPPVPPGQFGMENPYGLIPGMPWVLFAPISVFLAWLRRGRLGWWALGVMTAVGGTTAFLCLFGGNAGRYEVDFAPGFMLLAAIGALWLHEIVTGPMLRRAVVGLAWGLALWSSLFNILVSLQHNRLLFLNHPQVYARVAHWTNHIPFWIDRLTGHQYGPVEMRVVFPEGKIGKLEMLLATGREFLADYVYVYYPEKGVIQLGLEHTSRGSYVSEPIKIDFAAEHRVVVKIGSLYPPPAHPVHDGLPPAELRRRLHMASIELDGRQVLFARVDCYDSTERTPSIGTSGPNRPAFKGDFTGRLLEWRRLSEENSVASVSPRPGPLHLVVQLPSFTGKSSEPLFCSGKSGEGDLIYMTYLDEAHILVGHDHWGVGTQESVAVDITPGALVDIKISCPALTGEPSTGVVEVKINDQVVLREENRYYDTAPGGFSILENTIGASTANPSFAGPVLKEEYLQR